MERVIDPLATGLGTAIGWLAESGVLFVVFGLIWVAFGVGILWSPATVDQAWTAIGSLPLLLQLIVSVLFLPVVAALWVWETTWPFFVRLVLVVGFAGWSLLIFLPKTQISQA